MTEILVYIGLLTGAAFMLLAAIGIIRLPDLPTRMHASTKSGALGTSLIMISVAFAFLDPVVTLRALAIILFILITSPVAAHVIGRAGYFVGVTLWDGTVKDMLKESYDPESHYLRSGFEGMDEDDSEEMDDSTDADADQDRQ